MNEQPDGTASADVLSLAASMMHRYLAAQAHR